MRILLQQGGPATGVPGEVVVVGKGGSLLSPYQQQLRQQHSDIQRQLQEVENARKELVVQYRRSQAGSIDREVLDNRLGEIGTRLNTLNGILGDIESRMAQNPDAPVTLMPGEFPAGPHGLDTERITLIGAFALCMPLVIAAAIRLLRRGPAASTNAASTEMIARLQKIEQLVETTAIEVERIGEGQRYMTKVLAESDDALGVRAGSRGGRLPP